MNKWRCDHLGCSATCIGVGGAIGLRAIGWFARHDGARTFCPAHRPDSVPCVESGTDDPPGGKPCHLCAGEAEAKRIQEYLRGNS